MNPVEKPQTTDKGQKLLERVRRICMTLPEVTEKISHGEPTFFVRKKVFAMCSNNHHNDGHISVVIPAAIGVQEALIASSPKKFYRPPYVGVRGWVGVELDKVSDRELGLHLKEAWRLIAPERIHALLENSAGRTVSKKSGATEYVIDKSKERTTK
jgi:hypothetical protein